MSRQLKQYEVAFTNGSPTIQVIGDRVETNIDFDSIKIYKENQVVFWSKSINILYIKINENGTFKLYEREIKYPYQEYPYDEMNNGKVFIWNRL